jgi:hypothetical protein
LWRIKETEKYELGTPIIIIITVLVLSHVTITAGKMVMQQGQIKCLIATGHVSVIEYTPNNWFSTFLWLRQVLPIPEVMFVHIREPKNIFFDYLFKYVGGPAYLPMDRHRNTTMTIDWKALLEECFLMVP